MCTFVVAKAKVLVSLCFSPHLWSRAVGLFLETETSSDIGGTEWSSSDEWSQLRLRFRHLVRMHVRCFGRGVSDTTGIP